MNLRYVVALVALVLFGISQIAGEGGVIDSAVKGDRPAVAESGPAPAATPTSHGAAGLFAYDDRPAVGDTIATPVRVEPAGFSATPVRSFPQSASVGALSKEQLGLEVPTGIPAGQRHGG
jgi:hypothetical protein